MRGGYLATMKYSTLLRLVSPGPGVLLLILALLLAGAAISLANPWIAGLLTEVLLVGPLEVFGFGDDR